tara:strand:+ start:1750 stop:1914 length:165 start_codon:yes stop_codon:yes gene_type:complete
MEKIKNIIKQTVTSTLFHSALAAAVGFILLMESHPLYAGVAFGLAICKFLDAFK